jgi:DNA-binding response OmpR family regulator
MNARASENGPIIMVDDSENDAFIAERCYRRARIPNPFIVFQRGSEMIEYLEHVRKGDKVMPAAVLLDINMPEMNGFEILQAVRSCPDFQSVPVILMLTNSDNPRDIAKARELGADDFTVKPASFEDYVAFFQTLCRRSDVEPPS